MDLKWALFGAWNWPDLYVILYLIFMPFLAALTVFIVLRRAD